MHDYLQGYDKLPQISEGNFLEKTNNNVTKHYPLAKLTH